VIDVEEKFQRVASRPTNQGSNPAVLATQPLTSIRSAFEVNVLKRGTWLGIGFCDAGFYIHDGPTLGTQGCVNSSFFCQDSTTLRIQGNKDRLSVPHKLVPGDRVKVRIDFRENDVYYYRNGKLEGMLHAEVPLEEGKLYPCINISYGSVVTFVNESS